MVTDMRKKKIKRKEASTGAASKGFSLIEVTISMGLVFFILAGLAQVMSYSLLIKQKADIHRLAADIFSNQLERLKSAGLDAPDLSPGLHQMTVNDADSGKIFQLDWEVMDVNNNLKKIHLSLYPVSSRQKPAGVRATMYFSRHLNF
ncbi:MAG: hypothetical protein PHU81_09515 [Acidobacteriota bacterium]|nr:hypothetical protein [Acidobacteriota bacterium]